MTRSSTTGRDRRRDRRPRDARGEPLPGTLATITTLLALLLAVYLLTYDAPRPARLNAPTEEVTSLTHV